MVRPKERGENNKGAGTLYNIHTNNNRIDKVQFDLQYRIGMTRA